MHLSSLFRIVALGLATLSVMGCTSYSSVREKRPKMKPATLAGALIKRALGRPAKSPEAQIGRYLNAASLAAVVLETRPHNDQARRDYNFAIGRIFEVIHEANLEPWRTPIKCPEANLHFSYCLR